VYSGRLGVIYASQATNRSVPEGVGGPSRESSQLPIGWLGVIYDYMTPSSIATYFFIAIQIRVKEYPRKTVQLFNVHFVPCTAYHSGLSICC
jgi:hypothetical protein